MASEMRPGWYRRFDMHETLGFWDGKAWTGETAPAYTRLAPSVTTIAGGVVLGGLIVAVLGLLLNLVNW